MKYAERLLAQLGASVVIGFTVATFIQSHWGLLVIAIVCIPLGWYWSDIFGELE